MKGFPFLGMNPIWKGRCGLSFMPDWLVKLVGS
jgi:hypothetical protein